MTLLDLSKPPALDRAWATDFVRCISVLEPELPAINAIEHAVAAYRVTWLLDPFEAADLWLKALHNQGWISPTGWISENAAKARRMPDSRTPDD
jgi:hypothetical protein